jgi:hypothetical protein
MDFLLGTHHPSWLRETKIPLFVSVARLLDRKTFPRAEGLWGLDSAGFTQLSKYGRWLIPARTHAAIARRAAVETGMPVLVSIQDWMCEPKVRALTGKTVAEHQERTIASYKELTDLAPWLPWMPVLQGWYLDEYLSHIDQYAAAGVDLGKLPRVGVGSICRRQGKREAVEIINAIADRGIKIHAFGVKIDGLKLFAHRIASADSMAWSLHAWKQRLLLPGCTTHQNCANCIRWATQWYQEKIRPLVLAADLYHARLDHLPLHDANQELS